MVCDKNGVGANFGHGHVYCGDRYKCPECGTKILFTNSSPIHDLNLDKQEEYLNMDKKKNNDDKSEIKVGDYIENCKYHPVLVTEVDGDQIGGISLIDGSWPNLCSIINCKITKLSVKDAINIAIHWKDHPFHDWKFGERIDKKTFDERVEKFLKIMGWENHKYWKKIS